MGISLGRLWQMLYGPKEVNVLMLGLDAAGKTTILYRLKIGEIVSTVPTIGFNVENVHYGNINFCVWDVGGQEKLRGLWRHYYKGGNALIFVLDSADHDRLPQAKEALCSLLQEEELREAPVLVLGNKKDLPDAMMPEEVATKLGLIDVRDRPWLVQPAQATSGDGLYEGLDWLARELRRQRKR